VHQILILGHRGAADIPENTIPSFERALEQGADGLELDVRRTADGKLVVVHPPVVGKHGVSHSTYDQIRKLPKGYEVPLLEEVLQKFSKRTYLDIELKGTGFEEEAVQMIRKYVQPTNALISAFDPPTLVKLHELAPELQLGFIYNRTQDEESRHNCPVDVIIPQFKLASRELIAEVHSEELKVMPWTVNDEKEMDRLLELGVDGLITDYPEKLAAVLGRVVS
jgi:glycerophosphoryl diester phosphodiesterase